MPSVCTKTIGHISPTIQTLKHLFINASIHNFVKHKLQKELQAQKNQRLNLLKTRLEEAVSSRNSAMVTANTFIKNLEQAKDAEEMLIRSYETGTIDFNDVLEIQELQLKFQTGLIEAVKNYYMQSAAINYLSN
jgi:hypothetical protein